MKYQVIFQQGSYSSVDYETSNYDNALEVMAELQAEMYICGERDFYYYIKDIKEYKDFTNEQ